MYIYIYTYVYIYIYTYICIYIYIYIYTHVCGPTLPRLVGAILPRSGGLIPSSALDVHLHSAKGGAVETGCSDLYDVTY